MAENDRAMEKTGLQILGQKPAHKKGQEGFVGRIKMEGTMEKTRVILSYYYMRSPFGQSRCIKLRVLNFNKVSRSKDYHTVLLRIHTLMSYKLTPPATNV